VVIALRLVRWWSRSPSKVQKMTVVHAVPLVHPRGLVLVGIVRMLPLRSPQSLALPRPQR
jgi:uncharacterized protein involved in response to NO